MQVILEEYGRLLVIIICTAMFFLLYHQIVFGDHNVGFWYNTDIVNVGVFESSDIGGRDIGHDAGSSKHITYAPHFHPLNALEDGTQGRGKNYMDYYKIKGDELTYDVAMEIFTPITPGKKTGIWVDDQEEVSYVETVGPPTIIYTMYEVAIKDVDDDGNLLANPVIEYEEVPATDKYGNTKDPDGNPYGTHTQVKYVPTFEGELKPGDSVDIPSLTRLNMPPRFKLTYRIEVGNKKAEFQTMFIKDNVSKRSVSLDDILKSVSADSP